MIRNDIKALTAYHVADASDMLKLDAMENPFSLPETLQTEWTQTLAEVDINRYPDADMRELRQAIASREGLNTNQVLLGNGSDEIIQMLLMASEPGTCVIPSPTFVMYHMVCRWLKRDVANVVLSHDFSLDAETFLKTCARENAAIAFLACPNNPTGNLWSEETIRRIAENFNGLLIIDEAYAPFASRSHVNLIAPNVAILRTFSKMGWAGLRLGYLLGETEFIKQLNKVRMPYNINSLTQASAQLFLKHQDVFRQQTDTICEQRQHMLTALKSIAGIETFPSEANFILLRVNDADTVFDALKNKRILIKNLHGSHPLLAQCLRITIGTADENKAVIQALKEILS